MSTHERLMLLHSADPDEHSANWSRRGRPIVTFQVDALGRSQWIGEVSPQLRQVQFCYDPLRDLDAVLAATRGRAGGRAWIGFLSYELGEWIEPRVRNCRGSGKSSWPLIELAWCDSGVGDDDGLREAATGETGWFEVGELSHQTSAGQYQRNVKRVLEYIRAGDIFQANIAAAFTASFEGSARALGLAALTASQARYGAMLELCDGRTIVSLSPELFLHVDARSRRVITRPIKGTRPRNVSPEELLNSAKDAAELHMIVDLMRNDLGRVCETGSVRVDDSRSIETHGTVHHGVAQVSGTLRETAGVGDLLRATFPGGSVTGAPKIRAMQIIDELEARPRGPYCGAIGWFGDDGTLMLNVAIRTILLKPGELSYSAGCGIVADSDPHAEWRESLDKTAVLRKALAAQGRSDHSSRLTTAR